VRSIQTLPLIGFCSQVAGAQIFYKLTAHFVPNETPFLAGGSSFVSESFFVPACIQRLFSWIGKCFSDAFILVFENNVIKKDVPENLRIILG
jgi:hypothetical protein